MDLHVGDFVYEPQRIFCIGRNYKAHVAELNNQLPTEPVVFMKPATCLVPPGERIPFPKHGAELHHEAEVVILIGKEGKASSEDDAQSFIAGVTIGLDLTLRDVQNRLKSKGLPWEKAKAFDFSSPLGDFIIPQHIDLQNITFTCSVNNLQRQEGSSSMMIFPILTLIVALSEIWTLKPGDLIYTGTPEGVGPLESNDTITIKGESIGEFSWFVGE